MASAPIKGTAALIHCRYPHLSYGSLARLPQMVKGIDAKDVKVDYEAGSICRPCVEGKVTRAPFPPYDSAAGVMEVIHSDVSDPFPLSVGGSRYFVTLYEKKSGVIMATPIARKSDVGMALRTNFPILERMSGKKCQRIRTDGAKEYKSARLVEWYADKGIVHEETLLYCPESNGAAERINRRIKERARAVLAEKGVNDSL